MLGIEKQPQHGRGTMEKKGVCFLNCSNPLSVLFHSVLQFKNAALDCAYALAQLQDGRVCQTKHTYFKDKKAHLLFDLKDKRLQFIFYFLLIIILKCSYGKTKNAIKTSYRCPCRLLQKTNLSSNFTKLFDHSFNF